MNSASRVLDENIKMKENMSGKKTKKDMHMQLYIRPDILYFDFLKMEQTRKNSK